MADYSAEHKGALADVKAAGAAVTFTLTDPGTYNPETGTYASGSTTTVSGFAIQDVTGRPREYERLGLVEAEAPTLFFVPSAMGDTPELKATVTWGGVTHTTKSVAPFAPNGTAIFSYVIIAK